MILKILHFSCFHDCIDFFDDILFVVIIIIMILLLLLLIFILEKEKDKVETMGGTKGSPPKFL